MHGRGVLLRNAAIIRDALPSVFRLEPFGILFLVILGVALRFRQYLFNRSFWFDEASLALNVVDRDLTTLLTERLAYLQTAPPGFLVAARAMVVALGPFDWALRLVPFIAGVSVVALAVILARRELASTIARLTFVGLVALSPVLIFYSSEFKPYSSDALAALAILVVVSCRSTPYGTWLLASTGFVALASSLPAIFVAAPSGLLLLYEAVRSRQYKQVLLVGVTWLVAAALHGAYTWQAGADRKFMVDWWVRYGGFPHSPPDSVADLLWYPEALLRFIYMAFKTPSFAGPESNEALSDPAGLGLAIAFAVSLALAFIWRRSTGLLAAAAILLTLIASAFEIYPFSTRVVLFLVPLAFFIIAAAIDVVDFKLGWITSSCCALLLLFAMVPISLMVLVEPKAPFATKFKEALHFVAENSISGDALAIEPWSGRVFEFYSRFHAPRLPTFIANAARSMLERAKTEGYHRIWYLESSPVSPNAVHLIEEVGDETLIVFTWRRNGTRLVVFDFGPQ